MGEKAGRVPGVGKGREGAVTNGRAIICDYCISIEPMRVTVVGLGRACRYCGDVPDPLAFKTREIREVIRNATRAAAD